MNVTIRKPDTTVLAGPTCMEGQGYIDTITLPATGTYTIVINPEQHAFGNLTLKLYTVTDNTRHHHRGRFGGHPIIRSRTERHVDVLGHVGSAHLVARHQRHGRTVWFGCDVNVTIRKPDTSVLTGPTCMEGGGFIEPQTLPATGTYTIEIDPQAESSGNLTLALYSVTDYSNTITAGGSAVTVSITTPGQNGSVTFSGTNGQRVFLNGTNSTISAQVLTCDVSVTIRKPDTTVLAGPVCMEGSGYIDLQTLPSTGTYTIEVDPLAAATGNLTLTLSDVPADTSGSVTVNGSAVGVTLSTPGQNGTLTFSGTASQQITVQAASNTFGQLTVRLAET